MARYDAIAVYIMASARCGTLYVGVTSNLHKRTYEHREGITGGFTAQYEVKMLVWYELHPTMESAIRREKRLKKYTRAQKIQLVQSMNSEWDDLYPTLF